jgi:hypothetical protein
MAKTEHTARQIIENKLLMAMNAGDVVAVLLNRDDVEMLIKCLSLAQISPRSQAFLLDLKQLRQQAFQPLGGVE